jgi:hypothetical protein
LSFTGFSISPVSSTSHLENFLNVTLGEGSLGDPPGSRKVRERLENEGSRKVRERKCEKV